MKRKAIITSISGLNLTLKEKKLFKIHNPWGIILFKRNISSLRQLSRLTKDIKITMRDKHYPIMIDEEGGLVSRLSSFIDNSAYSQSFFGNLFEKNNTVGKKIYKNYINSICSIFNKIGININTVPVLDITTNKTHKIIGSRSYSKNKKTIRLLGQICIKSHKANKIATVIKHVPGHGRSLTDSHKTLPIINNSQKTLQNYDFECFKKMNSLFGMTAHILYSKIDPINVCTHSKKIICNIIRKKIGFKGILISDDISMKALKHDLLTNAKKSLMAGCNLVLYCSGNYNESLILLKQLIFIDDFTVKKTSEFYSFLS